MEKEKRFVGNRGLIGPVTTDARNAEATKKTLGVLGATGAVRSKRERGHHPEREKKAAATRGQRGTGAKQKDRWRQGMGGEKEGGKNDGWFDGL